MIASSYRRRSLAEWTLDGAFRENPDRRSVFGAAIVAGAAAMVLGGAPARALTLEKISPTLVGAIPPRNGIVPWDSLSKVEVRWGQRPRFPDAVAELDGQAVIIEGYMMVLDDDDPVDRFLLTAYRVSGFLCMPGGFTSVVAVGAAHSVRVVSEPLTMRGTFRLLSRNREGGLLYRLDNAVPIASA